MADRKDFEGLAVPHLSSVYRAALVFCGQEAVAQDLAQATFLKALERFGTFREGSNCKAWLFQILRNTWIDELRHRKVTGNPLPLEEALVAGPAKAGDEDETTAWPDARDVLEKFSDPQVIKALAELPEPQRLVLFLVDVEQLNHDEAAEICGVAVGTIKSRTSRARATLRGRLWAHAKDLGLLGREK